jgi:hypothetical protein
MLNEQKELYTGMAPPPPLKMPSNSPKRGKDGEKIENP